MSAAGAPPAGVSARASVPTRAHVPLALPPNQAQKGDSVPARLVQARFPFLRLKQPSARVSHFPVLVAKARLLAHVSCFGFLELIASSAHGLNQIWLADGAELVAQVTNIDVDDIREMLRVVVPHMLGNGRAAQHNTRVTQQKVEQGIFFVGKHDQALAALDLTRARIQRKIEEAQHGIFRLLIAPEQGPYSGL